MSKVDWSLAPEEATHFLPEQVARGWVPCFYKKLGDTWYARNIHDVDWYVDYDYVDVFEPLLIERPKQPQAWSGDGLPPAGTKCELQYKQNGWGVAIIKYASKSICVWLWDRPDALVEQVEYAAEPWNLAFRAIKTPEQIARDQRESAIREVMDIAQVDCRVTAARLVDAGFKR